MKLTAHTDEYLMKHYGEWHNLFAIWPRLCETADAGNARYVFFATIQRRLTGIQDRMSAIMGDQICRLKYWEYREQRFE